MIKPDPTCALCPRLAEFLKNNLIKFPDYCNAPVPSFGDITAELLIVGLAPGLHGANQTGRPFTNDYAGDLLYPTLIKFGLAKGTYGKRADDGLSLINTRITNAVRCVPPQNKPLPEEVKTCAPFLKSEIEAMVNLKLIIALGTLAHNAVLKNFALPLAKHKFAHGASFELSDKITLLDSYHCSRYNTSTKVLTPEMFFEVFEQAAKILKRA